MDRVLLTGATSFLGHHVARRLNERGIRPRVLELPGSNTSTLAGLNVERCAGDLSDAAAIAAACRGVDTLLHTAFKVSVGGGADAIAAMRQINIAGTERLLDAAAANGVSRAVITGSALAVGVNRRPEPLDENAAWSVHAFDLPYALIRRQAEEAALSRSRAGFVVCSAAPSFTLGPEDPIGAPANKLVKGIITRKVRFTLPVGFGCLDVRDFASGMVLAGERGGPGRRYLLSGENVMAADFIREAATLAGVQPPRLRLPPRLLYAAVAAVEWLSRIRGKPPAIERSVLQILGRYAWYDTTRARTELGWTPRPLRETLEDTIRWLRAHPS